MRMGQCEVLDVIRYVILAGGLISNAIHKHAKKVEAAKQFYNLTQAGREKSHTLCYTCQQLSEGKQKE